MWAIKRGSLQVEVAYYEGVNGVNRLATKGQKYYGLPTKHEKTPDYQQEKY